MLTSVLNISWIWNGAVRGAVRLKWFYPILFCQELRKVDLNAKMSKSKKKKLKKREKRNQQLMEEAMKHAMEAKVILSQNRIQSYVSGPDPKSDLSSLPLVFRGQENLNLSTISIMLTLYNHRIGINPFSHHQCYGSGKFFCTVPLTNGSESCHFRHCQCNTDLVLWSIFYYSVFLFFITFVLILGHLRCFPILSY